MANRANFPSFSDEEIVLILADNGCAAYDTQQKFLARGRRVFPEAIYRVRKVFAGTAATPEAVRAARDALDQRRMDQMVALRKETAKNKRDARAASIKEMLLRGVSYVEIAAAQKVSRKTIGTYKSALVQAGEMPASFRPARLKIEKEHTKPKPDTEYQAKTRSCLRCSDKFKSRWPGERICGRCRQSHEWRSGW